MLFATGTYGFHKLIHFLAGCAAGSFDYALRAPLADDVAGAAGSHGQHWQMKLSSTFAGQQ